MPVLGLTMEEGTVAEWLKHEGDSVQKDEPLLTVEADVRAVGVSDARVVDTPLARRLADERGVSIGDLRGTGPGGRITQDDVLRAADQRPPAAAVMPPAPVAMPPAPAEVEPAP